MALADEPRFRTWLQRIMQESGAEIFRGLVKPPLLGRWPEGTVSMKANTCNLPWRWTLTLEEDISLCEGSLISLLVISNININWLCSSI